MKLEKLGYTSKWIKFGLLNEDLFNEQLTAFESDKENIPSNFRYNTLMKWFGSKEDISNREIDNFLLLAHEDADQFMAGTAATKLFTSALISDEQFDNLKVKISEFGDWTKKLITRETLNRRLVNQEITFELYSECLEYKQKYDDNRLLILILDQTKDEAILADFDTNGCGKRIKKIAQKKLNQIRKVK